MGIFTQKEDQPTSAQTIVDHTHHEVHEGSHYYFHITSNIGSAVTSNLFIITPNTKKWIHMNWTFSSLEDTHFKAFEVCDGTTDAALTVYNSDRNSSNTAGLIIAPVASITTAGTLMWQDYLPADKFGSAESRADNEMILKQDTWYNLRILSEAASNIVTIKLHWYELTSHVG